MVIGTSGSASIGEMRMSDAQIAKMLGLSPGHPETWPMTIIRELRLVYEDQGYDAVCEKIAYYHGLT